MNSNGHGEYCYYCGKACSVLAVNPNEWPVVRVVLAHPDDPGVMKWHHAGCVSARLAADGTKKPKEK